MKIYFAKIKAYIIKHKVISVVILAGILLLGYWGYGKITSTSGETRYVLAAATKGTIISSVSGSGQVSALDQIDIKPSVSGAITKVNVKPGDQVKNGQTLFVIDNADAQKAVRDAELNLQSANLALQKLQIQNSSVNLNADLAKAYDDGFSAVSNTFLDLPSIITGLGNLWGNENLSDNAARISGKTAQNYRNLAETTYYAAQSSVETTRNLYRTLDYNSSKEDIEKIINETYDTTKLVSDAIKNFRNFVDFLAEDTGRSSEFTSYQNTLSTYVTTTNGDLDNLLTSQTNIKNVKDTSANSGLDIQTSELSVKQKQNALLDAQQTLSDYYIKAPFDGVMASVPVQKGDSASSGTVLGTIITSQQVATISLNEVDVAKIALGQKATLTFDAIPDLTISGKVIQIDSMGTVSQGVVSYNIKISFDTSDARIKPGMSVSAEIIINVKQDVLTVPNSAIKAQGNTNYVQMFDTPLPAPAAGVQGSPSLVPPINQTIEIGVTDDTSTEIISGLKGGDQVVVKIIITTSTTASAPSLINAVSGNRAGGEGAARVLRGD
jgi:HlyD family secretion protein